MAGRRRTTRADIPTDPAATMRALRACRNAMIEVHRCVRPMGPGYHAAAMVISAIDAFATFLSGERFYFSDIGSGATEGQRTGLHEKMDREHGEKPWQP